LSTVYCITEYENRLCGCLLKDSRMFQLQLFGEQTSSLLGNIYVGKVKNILKNIEAAFVEIAGGQSCFLPFSEIKNPILTNRVFDGRILCGDELLVQVKKDAVKTKDPVLTAQLSFKGRYCAVQPDKSKRVHYSHKLSENTKKRLSEGLKEVVLPEGLSLIVRTQAGELCADAQIYSGKDSLIETQTAFPDCVLTLEPLRKEARQLLEQAQRIIRIGQQRTVFSRLEEAEPDYIRLLSDFKEFPDKIITDSVQIHTVMHQYLQRAYPEYLQRLVFYQDKTLSLSSLYGFKSKIPEARSRQVWLKSGGYLVIEPTEALTVIDVNTGKYIDKKNMEETFCKINLEAAQEIARQLQLRNISGIIIVDFINMEDKKHNELLLDSIKAYLKEDTVASRLIDMTPLGLVEITRQKVHMSLEEQFRQTDRV